MLLFTHQAVVRRPLCAQAFGGGLLEGIRAGGGWVGGGIWILPFCPGEGLTRGCYE
jgi:hypothetical protein